MIGLCVMWYYTLKHWMTRIPPANGWDFLMVEMGNGTRLGTPQRSFVVFFLINIYSDFHGLVGAIFNYMKLSYHLEPIKDLDEGGYVAYYLEFLRCLICSQTIERAVENAKKAKRVWLERRSCHRISGTIESIFWAVQVAYVEKSVPLQNTKSRK